MLKASCASKIVFGLAFEREQADGLLLQFIHAAGAALARRLEDMRHRARDLVDGVQPVQHQRQGDGGGIGDHVHGIGRNGVSRGLDHGSAQAALWRFFQACVRSIRCACGASFRALLVDSAEPARKITSAHFHTGFFEWRQNRRLAALFGEHARSLHPAPRSA